MDVGDAEIGLEHDISLLPKAPSQYKRAKTKVVLHEIAIVDGMVPALVIDGIEIRRSVGVR